MVAYLLYAMSECNDSAIQRLLLLNAAMCRVVLSPSKTAIAVGRTCKSNVTAIAVGGTCKSNVTVIAVGGTCNSNALQLKGQ